MNPESSLMSPSADHHGREEEDEEERGDDEYDDEIAKFQMKLESMGDRNSNEGKIKVSFDGTWIDSLKQRLQD